MGLSTVRGQATDFYIPLTLRRIFQARDGHWPGEYGGPMSLIPGLAIGSYTTGIPFTNEERREMIRYLMNHANENGGWGMYVSFHLSTRPISQNTALVTSKGLPPRLERR